jgi:glycosyltransferase involved in cell wall biosynthesis
MPLIDVPLKSQMPQHIVVATAYDPRDVSKWSGTPYFIYEAIAGVPGGIKITYIRGGLKLLDAAARALNKASKIFGIHLDYRFSTLYARLTGAYTTLVLLFVKPGPILAIAASNCVPYIVTKRNLIYISDTTFCLISRMYPDFKNFPNWLKVQGNKNEAITLSRSRHIIYSSEWASRSARIDYGIPPERIHQLPFGPNIPEGYIKRFLLPKAINPTQEVKLLFVSADWKRKNGDFVIETCRLLIARGMTVRAILIGDTPNSVRQLDFVDCRGFLRKSIPKQLEELCKAYQEAHFLLLPTTAEATAIVLSEAQAFGVPPIAFDVGGTGSVVKHRQSGLLLSPGSTPRAFADEILRYVENPSLYLELSNQCLEWHREQANWRRWASLIVELAAGKDPSAPPPPRAG